MALFAILARVQENECGKNYEHLFDLTHSQAILTSAQSTYHSRSSFLRFSFAFSEYYYHCIRLTIASYHFYSPSIEHRARNIWSCETEVAKCTVPRTPILHFSKWIVPPSKTQFVVPQWNPCVAVAFSSHTGLLSHRNKRRRENLKIAKVVVKRNICHSLYSTRSNILLARLLLPLGLLWWSCLFSFCRIQATSQAKSVHAWSNALELLDNSYTEWYLRSTTMWHPLNWRRLNEQKNNGVSSPSRATSWLLGFCLSFQFNSLFVAMKISFSSEDNA